MSNTLDNRDRGDSEFKRAIVFSKRIAHSHNGQVSPPILFMSILASEPNVVTKIFNTMKIDVSDLKEKTERVIKFSISDKKDDNLKMDYIGLTNESANIMKKASDRADERRDASIGCHYLLMALYYEDPDVSSLLKEAGFSMKKFNEIIRSSVVSKTELPKEKYSDNKSKSPQKEKVKPNRGHNRGAKVTLAEFAVNLTDLAGKGDLDPVIGREDEIDRTITVLKRRTKSNPILLGAGGVGKTAIVEGVAQRIADKAVPDSLKNNVIWSLDLATLVAGTTYRGQFEERIKAILEEVRTNKNYIVFIDEVHNIFGAGSAQGTLDASNIMKPSLARGDLRCIGATTREEFNKTIKKDKALDRRFQPVNVEEPNRDETLNILNGLKHKYEKHHNCVYSEDVMPAVVYLTGTYLHDRHYPDKAIDVIDEAGAKYAGLSHQEEISVENIKHIIAQQAHIPVSLISGSKWDNLAAFEPFLRENFIGQNNVIDSLCESVKQANSGTRNYDSSMLVSIMVGPTGTGKDYLAELTAEGLIGNKNAVIDVPLGQFGEGFNQSRITGAPPGYVGYGETQTLPDKIAAKPHCVVHFSELEKAHTKVIHSLLDTLEKGEIHDSSGNVVNCRNVIFMFSSNIAQDDKGGGLGFGEASESGDGLNKQKVLRALEEKYGAEFVNRIDNILIFKDFGEKEMVKLADFHLDKLACRVYDNTQKLVTVSHTKGVAEKIVELSESEHGMNAKKILRVIRNKVEGLVSMKIMESPNDPCVITLKVLKNKLVASRRNIKCPAIQK